MKFKECSLNEIKRDIIDYRGKTPKKLKSEWSDRGYRALSAKNIKTGKIVQPETIRYVNEELYFKWMKQEVEPETILITSEAPFGEVYFWDSDEKIVLSQRLFGIKINDDFNAKYIYYYMTGYDFQNQLISRATGSTVMGLRQPQLLKCKIKFPSLQNQNKIAKILSNIDDKIEVNNQINDNLQNMSKELYKRWFIDFEFPDEDGNPYKSSGGKMIDSELGEIPKGWEIGNFDDGILTKIIKSGVDSFQGEKRYVATADVDGTKINNFSKLKYSEKPSRANMTPIKNSVWFAKMKGSIKNILVEEYMEKIIANYIFSTGFLGIECLNKSTSYIWNIINDDKFISDKDNLSTGTLMAGINNGTIKNYEYLIPTAKTLQKYNEITENINRKIYYLYNENFQLINLRDTLLPKLLNGEIDLEQVEV